MNDWQRLPTYSEMESLEKRLIEENEDKLLGRNYMYWSRDLRRPVTKTVGSILEGGVEQLMMYMEAVAKGQTKSWNDSTRGLRLGMEVIFCMDTSLWGLGGAAFWYILPNRC